MAVIIAAGATSAEITLDGTPTTLSLGMATTASIPNNAAVKVAYKTAAGGQIPRANLNAANPVLDLPHSVGVYVVTKTAGSGFTVEQD